MSTHRFDLEIEIPDVRLDFGQLSDDLELIGADLRSPLTRVLSGEVELAPGVDPDAVRRYLVNEVCKDYVGKTVTVKHFNLTAL